MAKKAGRHSGSVINRDKEESNASIFLWLSGAEKAIDREYQNVLA